MVWKGDRMPEIHFSQLSNESIQEIKQSSIGNICSHGIMNGTFPNDIPYLMCCKSIRHVLSDILYNILLKLYYTSFAPANVVISIIFTIKINHISI